MHKRVSLNQGSGLNMRPQSQHHLGLVLVTAAAVAWSTAPFFTRLLPFDSWTILFWRGVFGGGSIVAFLALTEGRDGLLFRPGDADELAACLRRLWDDPERVQEMGRNGWHKVRARYGPETHYTRILSLYKSLVSP